MSLTKTPSFSNAFLLSLFVHGALFFGLTWTKPGEDFTPTWAAGQTIEVDLTRPFRLTSDPRLARRSENPGTGAAPVAVPKPGKSQPGGGMAQKGAEWTLPTEQTKTFVPPVVEGNPLSPSTAPATGTSIAPGEGGGLGGLGTGGDGEVDWVYLTEMPRLLNREEMLRNIHRFYPEEERRAGREGRVVARLRLTREGQVSGVDIETSAGTLFDDAARKVLSLARFSPARAGDRVVAVKIRQSIDFRLAD